MRRVKVAVLVACACLVGAGTAAGRPASTPQAYVSTLCGSVAGWERAVSARTSAYERLISASKVTSRAELVRLRAQLVAYLAGVEKETSSMLAAVRAAGVPAVPGGAALAHKVDAALGQVDGLFLGALAKVKAMPLSPTAFASQANALSHTLAASGTRLQKAFSALDVGAPPALESAGKASPACRKLAG